jgi:putative acetyltransferase
VQDEIIIRKIIADDDAKLAQIIRSSLKEFGAAKPGTVYFDPTTDHLYKVFQTKQSAYFVAEINNEVVGGAGVFPTEALPDKTCELVKMYLSPRVRGKGIGKLLLEKCMHEAKKMGYKKMYIETMPELTKAIPMYEKYGFKYIPGPLGNSGHGGCDLFMLKDL